MYGILINGKLQAFHKDKNVVNTYADMYATSNPKDMIEMRSSIDGSSGDNPLVIHSYVSTYFRWI